MLVHGVSVGEIKAAQSIVAALRESDTDVLMNYLPVGSQKATEFYAECALEAGVSFVNNIPVFIASDPAWAERFQVASQNEEMQLNQLRHFHHG